MKLNIQLKDLERKLNEESGTGTENSDKNSDRSTQETEEVW